MFKPGDILRYNYLWARQFDAGEESGRKARPVCLVVKTQTKPANLFLFPLTSQPPAQDRVAFALGEIECRRAGLDFPTWLVVDEYNYLREDELFDLEAARPVGALSPAVLRKVALLIKQAAEKRRLRAIHRA